MLRLGRVLGVALAMVLGTAGISRAELTNIDNFGEWTLIKDSDLMFGTLGYRLTLDSTTDGAAATLTLSCYFDKDTISHAIEVSSESANLRALSGSPLLRYDDDEVRPADWIAMKDPSSVGFSSGGNNFMGDQDNPAFEEAVRTARREGNTPLQEFLSSMMTANGIHMFFWNMTVRNKLALSFGEGGNRTAMLFDVSNGDAAIDRLLGDCDRDAHGTQPQNGTSSPREAAQWQLLETVNTEYKSIALDADECLELHAVSHRRGDGLIVDELTGPGEYDRTRVESGDIVIQGPKQRLEVFFGDNASAGEFNARSWTRKSARCEDD